VKYLLLKINKVADCLKHGSCSVNLVVIQTTLAVMMIYKK